jgi:hypothetical protein
VPPQSSASRRSKETASITPAAAAFAAPAVASARSCPGREPPFWGG